MFKRVMTILISVLAVAFVALGATIKLDAVLGFSDALVFLICVPNIFGLIVLTPVARAEISGYWSRLSARAPNA